MRRIVFGVLAISMLALGGCQRERERGRDFGDEMQRESQGVGEELREEGGQLKENVEDRGGN